MGDAHDHSFAHEDFDPHWRNYEFELRSGVAPEGKNMQAIDGGRSTQKRMTLESIAKGKQTAPERILLFGVEGIGKSTFASDAPSPIFLPGEKGTKHLNISRLPRPESWRDVLDAVEMLMVEKHDYKTFVIDTIGSVEPLAWEVTCATKKNGDKRALHIEDYGFAKGYEYVLDVAWRPLIDRLDALSERRGMNIIIVAHSIVSNFKSPDTEDYQRYEVALQKKSADLFKRWADHVLFAAHELVTHKQNNRAKGVSTGNRLIYTTKTAAYDGKNRGDLPESLPLSWDAFSSALSGQTPDSWRIRIAKLLENTDESLASRVNAAVQKAGDSNQALAKIHNHLSVTLSKENAQ